MLFNYIVNKCIIPWKFPEYWMYELTIFFQKHRRGRLPQQSVGTGRNVWDKCILDQKTVATGGDRGENVFWKKQAQNLRMLTLEDKKFATPCRGQQKMRQEVYLSCRLGRKWPTQMIRQARNSDQQKICRKWIFMSKSFVCVVKKSSEGDHSLLMF